MLAEMVLTLSRHSAPDMGVSRIDGTAFKYQLVLESPFGYRAALLGKSVCSEDILGTAWQLAAVRHHAIRVSGNPVQKSRVWVCAAKYSRVYLQLQTWHECTVPSAIYHSAELTGDQILAKAFSTGVDRKDNLNSFATLTL